MYDVQQDIQRMLLLMTTWTPARIAELTRRWNAGETGDQIAKAMSLTKNKVLGKRRRLGLEARANPIRPRPSQPRREAPMVPLVKREWSNQFGERTLPRAMAEQLPKTSGNDKWRCQFPMTGDTLDHRKPDDWTGHNDSWKCGARTKLGSSYCPEHHEECHNGLRWNALDSTRFSGAGKR